MLVFLTAQIVLSLAVGQETRHGDAGSGTAPTSGTAGSRFARIASVVDAKQTNPHMHTLRKNWEFEKKLLVDLL